METTYRDLVIRKITEMSKEQVSKVLIFMAGMEAEHGIDKSDNISEWSCEGAGSKS